jgi:hypothetical protein
VSTTLILGGWVGNLKITPDDRYPAPP